MIVVYIIIKMSHSTPCSTTLFSLLLLSLLCSLVEVHSQTEIPYVSFRGESLPNHSYVDLSLVGEDTGNHGNTVRCHTDLHTCCSMAQGLHRGDWYFPDRSRVPFSSSTVHGVYEIRSAHRVDLRHRNSTLSPSGIYRCDIAVHGSERRETVYVGVYSSGGIVKSKMAHDFHKKCKNEIRM